MMKRSVLVALVGVVTLVTGCGSDSKGIMPEKGSVSKYDSDTEVSGENNEPARRINFPYNYPSVAAKCDGQNMVYSPLTKNNRGSGTVAVVPNDQRCTKEVATASADQNP